MNYEDQLEDQRWKDLRSKILQRDWNMCQKCMSGKNLDVHHKQYIEGRMAWDYPHFYLITLCRKCHFEEHKDKPIQDFVKPPDVIQEAFARIRQSVWAIKELMKREKQNG